MNKVGGLIKTVFLLIDRLYWFWLLVAAPFLVFPSARRSLFLLVIPATWVLHWAVSYSDTHSAKAESRLSNHKQHMAIAVTPLNLALLLLFIMVLVSLFTTYDLSNSLGKITGLVFGLGVFFTVVRMCMNERGFWICLGVFMCTGLGVAILGGLGTNWVTTKITLLNPIFSRLPTLFRSLPDSKSGFHPNEVAGTLIWILPMVLSLFLVIIFRFRIFSGQFHKVRIIFIGFLLFVTNLIMVAVLILTQSRGAYIGFLFSVLFMTVAAFPRKWRLVYVTGLVLILALAGVLVSAHWGEVQGWFSDGSSSIENSAFSEVSLEQRVVIWSNAIKGIQDFPFTGMGLNNFRKMNHFLYLNSAIGPEVDLGHAHNEFLQVGVDLGISGIIAFISLYLGAFWMLVKTWRTTFLFKPTPRGSENLDQTAKLRPGILANGLLTRSIVLGLGGGLLAHFFYGLVDAVALGAKPGFLFWVLLGLITGLFSLAYKSNFLGCSSKQVAFKG